MVAENDAAARFVQAANKKEAARVARRDGPRKPRRKPPTFRQKVSGFVLFVAAFLLGQAIDGAVEFEILIGICVFAVPYLVISFLQEKKAKNGGGTGV